MRQETRRWDEQRGETQLLRAKEETDDYRYFPEPDLPPVALSDAWVEELRRTLPELPWAKRERYRTEYRLPAKTVEVLTEQPSIAALFEAAVEEGGDPAALANWMTGDVLSLVGEGKRLSMLRASQLATLVQRVEARTISRAAGKRVLAQLFSTHDDVDEIIAREDVYKRQRQHTPIGQICPVPWQENPCRSKAEHCLLYTSECANGVDEI